jgi:hypothetical protein
MKSKPFLVPLVAVLFVGFAFAAVGLGWGDGIEGWPVAKPLSLVALALDSDASDAEGDLEPLRALVPFPDSGRNVTIDGNTATLVVPTWLLGDPSLFQWAAAVVMPEQDVVLDAVPKGRVQLWSGGVSEEVDSVNPALPHYQDLIQVRVRSSGALHIEFRWRFRGDIPSGESDLAYVMILSTGYRIAVLPRGQDWGWFADRLGLPFDWVSRPYEDILSAAVRDNGDAQLTFEMTTAQDIPAVPADVDGYPWFTWMLDVDGDQASGGASDINVAVRWDPRASSWEAALRGWNGERYEDLQATVAFTRTGSTVSATVNVADLGVVDHFNWRAQTSINVGREEEQFFAMTDSAPDAEWVEEVGPGPTPTATVSPTTEPTVTPTPTETLSGAQRIYLPLISRGAAT